MNTPTAQELLRYLTDQHGKELIKEDKEELEKLRNYEKIAKTAAIVYPITVWAVEKMSTKAYFKKLKGTNLFIARLPYNLMHLFNIQIAVAGHSMFFSKNQKRAIKIAENYDKDMHILGNLGVQFRIFSK